MSPTPEKDKEVALLNLIESSLENINKVAVEMLQRAGRSKVLPKVYKDSLQKLSLVSIAAAGHLYNFREVFEGKET